MGNAKRRNRKESQMRPAAGEDLAIGTAGTVRFFGAQE